MEIYINQSSSRRGSYFKTRQRYWTSESFQSLAHCLWWKPKIDIGAQAKCTKRQKRRYFRLFSAFTASNVLVIRRAQMFSSADESLKNETHLLLSWFGSLMTLHTFVFVHITYAVKPVRILIPRSRVSKRCLRAELCFHRFVHFARVCIWKHAFLRMRFFSFGSMQ